MGRGKVRNGSGLVIHVWHTALRKEQVSARLQAGVVLWVRLVVGMEESSERIPAVAPI